MEVAHKLLSHPAALDTRPVRLVFLYLPNWPNNGIKQVNERRTITMDPKKQIEQIENLKEKARLPIEEIEDQPGLRHSRICFFHPRHTQGVLWELVEYATANSKKG
jgi:hypothetical protein